MKAIFFYFVLIAVIIVQRLFEMRKAERHRSALLSRGGVEHGAGHYPWMVILHALWFLSCILEAWLRQPPHAAVWIPGFVLLLAGQILRFIAISELGESWTTRIIVVPDSEPVTSGVFSRIRHPNYAGVMLEIIGLPLVFGSWVTVVIFSILNGLLLAVRIREEEKALQRTGKYRKVLDTTNRFIP